MTSKEPVSAYGAFMAAKDLRNSNKKYAKKQNGSANSNVNKRGKIIKLSSSDAAVGKFSSSKMGRRNKKKHQKKKTDHNNSRTQAPAVGVTKPMSKEEQRRQVQQAVIALTKNQRILETINEDSQESVSSDMSVPDDSSSYEERETLTNVSNNDRVPPVILPELPVRKSSIKRKRVRREKRTTDKTRKPTITDLQALKKPKTNQRQPLPVVATSDVVMVEVSEQPCTSRYAMEQAAKAEAATELASTTILNRDSIHLGKTVFKSLITPMETKEFFEKYWERKYHWFSRQNNSMFSYLLSFEEIDQVLLENNVQYGKDIDIVIYKNGKRRTPNPEGRALPVVVWDLYQRGHSVRIPNPSKYFPQIYMLSAKLQEFFHCYVGANIYLTPPNSQGFAPHDDDIDAFVMQIEGRKHWKLYKPHNNYELPRVPSRNYDQEELNECIFNEVLCPGDLLYFPRGTVHQADTEPGYHSLHVTFSVFQKQCYADLLELMVPKMLEQAIANNVEFRKNIPIDAFRNAGVAFNDSSSDERVKLMKKVTSLMKECFFKTPLDNMVDSAIDDLGIKFQREAVPPLITQKTRPYTIFGYRAHLNKNGQYMCRYKIKKHSRIRLLKANIMRLVKEEGTVRVYYHTENDKVYGEVDPIYIEIREFEVESIKFLIKSYPNYIKVSDLPLKDVVDKVGLAYGLWERGVIMLKTTVDGKNSAAT